MASQESSDKVNEKMDNQTMDDNTDPLNCRMYEEEYPSIDDIVFVQINRIIKNDQIAYCSLIEYNNIEGTLPFSELSRKRYRSVKDIICQGDRLFVQVIRANKKQEYIDLSKKEIISNDIPDLEKHFNKSKIVHTIIRKTVSDTGSKIINKSGKHQFIAKYTMKQLYKTFAWDMAKKFGHCYDGLKWAITNWNEFLKQYPQIPEDVRDPLFKNIEKRLKPQLVTVRSNIELTCFGNKGVDGVKMALKEGMKLSTDKLPLTIKVIAPPLFSISVNTLDENIGKELIKNVILAISNAIIESQGNCVIVKEPHVIAIEQ